MAARKTNLLTLGAWGMAVLILGGVSWVLAKANGVAKQQTEHNIDKEAHPVFEGQLNMMHGDVTRLGEEVKANGIVLGAVRIEQAEQRILLEQIKDTVNGDN